MYIPFWPTPVASSRFLPPNSGQPIPAARLAANRAQIQRIGEGAALGYIAAQTVAPDMDNSFLNSTGQGTPVRPPGPNASAFSDAPTVVPLNPSSWTAPQPAMVSCAGAFSPGVPWSDALYRPVGGTLNDGTLWGWAKDHPWLAALAAGAAGFGLYNLKRKRV